MKYARIIDSVAVDVVNGNPAGFFHPEVASGFVTVPDNVVPGSVYDAETETWADPPPPAEEEEIQEAPPPAPSLSKLDFLQRFTPAERIALRGAVAVELTDADLIKALAYLEANSLLAAGRKDEILDGPTAATSEE